MPSSEFQTWFAKFSQTGNISPLSLGMTRAAVAKLFGRPTDYSAQSSEDRAAIWKYDELEFHFAADQTLQLIYMERSDVVVISIPRLAL